MQTQERNDFFVCSPLTKTVAKQTTSILKLSGYKADYLQHDEEISIKLLINGNYIARVIEGCNSMSIIILFVAFIIAFSGPLITTALYIIIGSTIIYTMNVLRIAFLTAMLYKFPEQQEFLHNLVFPAIIYGTTFLLWIIWVNKFSNLKNE